MVKKILIIGGVGLAGFGLYRYFKTQVELALGYDYTIKDFTFVGIEGDNVNVKVVIQITNKSNFDLTINSFDLDLYYNNLKFATVVSNNVVVIKPNSAFKIETFGAVSKSSIQGSVTTFVTSVLARKPIDIVVDGTVKVVLMGVKSTVKFDKQKVNYSADFASDWGFGKQLDNLKEKYPKLFSFFEKK